MSGVRLGPLPIFATVNAEAGRYRLHQRASRREVDRQDLSLIKADFTPSIRAPLSTLPFLQVNATAAIARPTTARAWRTTSRTQIEVPVTRSYGDMRVDVIGPVFSRVFNPNNAMADRMKHVIEPTFSVQRRTEIANQDRIPTATGYDIIVGGVTQMTYGLTNRVMVRKDVPRRQPQAGAPRELLNVSVRQSYYTDANAEQVRHLDYSYGYSTAPPNPFSPISLAARATPVDAAGDRLPAGVRPAGAPTTAEAARHEPERLAAVADGRTCAAAGPARIRADAATGRSVQANNIIQATSPTSA